MTDNFISDDYKDHIDINSLKRIIMIKNGEVNLLRYKLKKMTETRQLTKYQASGNEYDQVLHILYNHRRCMSELVTNHRLKNGEPRSTSSNTEISSYKSIAHDDSSRSCEVNCACQELARRLECQLKCWVDAQIQLHKDLAHKQGNVSIENVNKNMSLLNPIIQDTRSKENSSLFNERMIIPDKTPEKLALKYLQKSNTTQENKSIRLHHLNLNTPKSDKNPIHVDIRQKLHISNNDSIQTPVSNKSIRSPTSTQNIIRSLACTPVSSTKSDIYTDGKKDNNAMSTNVLEDKENSYHKQKSVSNQVQYKPIKADINTDPIKKIVSNASTTNTRPDVNIGTRQQVISNSNIVATRPVFRDITNTQSNHLSQNINNQYNITEKEHHYDNIHNSIVDDTNNTNKVRDIQYIQKPILSKLIQMNSQPLKMHPTFSVPVSLLKSDRTTYNMNAPPLTLTYPSNPIVNKNHMIYPSTTTTAVYQYTHNQAIVTSPTPTTTTTTTNPRSHSQQNITDLSPYSFRSELNKMHHENLFIKNDIARFRRNLKMLQSDCALK